MNDTEQLDVVFCFKRGTLPKDAYEAGKVLFKAAALKLDENAVQTVYTLDGETHIDTSFEDAEAAAIFMVWIQQLIGKYIDKKVTE